MFSDATFKGIFEVNNFRTNAAIFWKYFCGRSTQLLVALGAVYAALLMHHASLWVKRNFYSGLVKSFSIAFSVISFSHNIKM